MPEKANNEIRFYISAPLSGDERECNPHTVNIIVTLQIAGVPVKRTIHKESCPPYLPKATDPECAAFQNLPDGEYKYAVSPSNTILKINLSGGGVKYKNVALIAG